MSIERSRYEILVVDDERDAATMLARRLRGAGFRARALFDGYAAVRQILGAPPDLVLMDLSMPGIDGWQATAQVKASPRCRDIPVIALTCHVAAIARERAILAGIDEYATKPVHFPGLIRQIERHLARAERARRTAPEGTGARC